MRGTRAPARLIVVVAVLVTAGCATVPTGGRVVTGRPAQRAEPIDDPYVRMVPVAPGKDWAPDRIVEGFLAASAGFDDQHEVARQYLAPGVVWQPDPRPVVTVYDKQTDVLATSKPDDPSGMVSVRGSQLGRIGSDGQYEADARPLEQTFRLAKNAQGQWRISELPERLTNSLLLSSRDVARAFRTRNLYFFAPDAKVLVPNPVFLPLVIRRDLPAQIVVAELNGPTAWLSRAVTTWFPTGTRLLGGVDVTDGIATVNLSKEAEKGNRQGMSAQLMWALKQLSEVKGMRLQIDGKTVNPGLPDATQSPRDWARNDPDSTAGETSQPVYLRDPEGRLEELAGNKTGKVLPLSRVRMFEPAVSLDAHQVAGLTKTRNGVLMGDLTSGPSIQRVLTSRQPGSTFTQPSWDRLGNLWVVETTNDHSWLWIKEPGKPPVRVDHWDLGASKVLALRVARDGVRVAAIVQADRHAQIHLGRIAGYGSGSLTADNFLPISSDVDAIDLAWADADELAVLGRTDQAGQALPYTVPVSGGSSRPIGTGTQGNMRTITAAPNSPVLVSGPVTGKDSTADQVCRLHDPDDRLFSQWDCPIAGADPAYPG
ncbi:LpqB family beta-propeller domain-containing protein [Actinomadura scrupuli]|uniref:LpqB family beta-propeller domain-containing protein n=1 Tax=Actinomadura scrupuli TaxID=559629 RepID=UPI003D97DE79